MVLVSITKDGTPVVYQEVCFTFMQSVNLTEAGYTDGEQTFNGRLERV